MFPNERYVAALAAGDWGTAEAMLRQALGESGDDRIRAMLASFLRDRGRSGEAEALLRPALEQTPTAEVLAILAGAQHDQQKFADCEHTLERLVSLNPAAGLETYRFLAKMKSVRLGPEGGRDVMRRAMAAHPGNTEISAAYADTLPEKEATLEFERQLEQVRADPARSAYLLHRLTALRVPMLRERRGLPPRTGISWPDTRAWSDTELLAKLKHALQAEIGAGSRRGAARLDLASIAAAEEEWDLAETFLAELRQSAKRSPADFLALGGAFHGQIEAMTDADILVGLPAVATLARAPARGEATAFLSSDQKYFARFTLPFLHELEDAGVPLDVHVHILDGDEAEWREIHGRVSSFRCVGITLTAEASGASARSRVYARLYYHAVRYVRLFQELRRTQRPMWVLDCDVRMLRDPRPLLASLAGYDLALTTSPEFLHPHIKINASCVGFAPSPLGLAFARNVAAYIVYWKDRGTWGWGVDQAALYGCYAHLCATGRQPATLFLGEDRVNVRGGDTGMIRFLSGIDKHVAPAGSPA